MELTLQDLPETAREAIERLEASAKVDYVGPYGSSSSTLAVSFVNGYHVTVQFNERELWFEPNSNARGTWYILQGAHNLVSENFTPNFPGSVMRVYGTEADITSALETVAAYAPHNPLRRR